VLPTDSAQSYCSLHLSNAQNLEITICDLKFEREANAFWPVRIFFKKSDHKILNLRASARFLDGRAHEDEGKLVRARTNTLSRKIGRASPA
jgi:hypothetical protein